MAMHRSNGILVVAFLSVGLLTASNLPAAPITYNVTYLGVSSAIDSNDGMFSGGSLNDAGQVAMNVAAPITMAGYDVTANSDGYGLGVDLYNSYGPSAGQISMIVPPSLTPSTPFRLNGDINVPATNLDPIPSATNAGAFHALGMNNQGVVTGYLDNGNAALDSNGKIQDLGRLPGSFQTSATAINDAGTAVGIATFMGIMQPVANHAVVFDGGQAYDLNDLLTRKLNAQLTWVDGINNLGQILAEGFGPNLAPRFYLLTPDTLPEPAPPQIVPEPSSWLIFSLGLAVVALTSRSAIPARTTNAADH